MKHQNWSSATNQVYVGGNFPMFLRKMNMSCYCIDFNQHKWRPDREGQKPPV
ncbi:hypothetical protein Hanom_Chr05g00442431 [Helianthus anomalus]